MELDVIAQTYAGALAELSQDDMEKVNDDLLSLAKVLESSDSVRVFFEAPGIAGDAKKEKAQKVFSSRIDERVLHLFLILIDRGRVTFLSEIGMAFQALCDKKLGRVRVELTTDREFSSSYQEEIEEQMKKALDGQKDKFGISKENQDLQYIITRRVNPSLLGGVMIRVGDYLLDASVSDYLRRWRRSVHLSKPNVEKAWSES